MAIGTVKRYNQMENILMGDAGRQWDDATAGSCMFVLAKNTYAIDVTDTTLADVGTGDTDWIETGDGAPINVTTPDVDDTTTAGITFLDSDAANFGASVTVTAKFLLCVQPVAPGTIASTSKILWAVDLDTTDGTTSKSSSASDYVINPPANGWIKYQNAA